MNKKRIGAVLFSLVFSACAHASLSSLDASSSIAMQPHSTSLKQGEEEKHDTSEHNIAARMTRETGQQQADVIASQASPDSQNQLNWSAKGNVLKVTNTGLSTLHLKTEIKLLPDNMPGTLEKSYILPGETLVAYGVCKHHLPTQTSVVIEALSEDGADLGSKIMPLSR